MKLRIWPYWAILGGMWVFYLWISFTGPTAFLDWMGRATFTLLMLLGIRWMYRARRRMSAKNTYRDRDGNPITRDEWVRHTEDPDYWRVAQSVITGAHGKETAILTIWIGMTGLPDSVLCTAIFVGDWGDEVRQYATLDEALEGHRDVVKHRLSNEQNYGPATVTEGVDDRWYEFTGATWKESDV